MSQLEVHASQLRAGDVLLASHRTVIHGPVRGVRTPSGKVEVTVRNERGIERTYNWHRDARMMIEREQPEDRCWCGELKLWGACVTHPSPTDDELREASRELSDKRLERGAN